MSQPLTKHIDDIRRGLRRPTRYDLSIDHYYKDVRADPKQNGDWCQWSEVEPLIDELELLRKKVEWLRLAEHLVIWNGERWQVRPEHGGKPL